MNIPYIIGAVLVLFVLSTSLLKYTWDIADVEQKRTWAQRLHVLLPRFVTKQRWFQEFHYQIVWSYHYSMFWSACFPEDKHIFIDFGIGYHCKRCGHWMRFSHSNTMSEKTLQRALKWLL